MTIFENENLTIDVKDDIVKLDTRIKLRVLGDSKE